MTLPVSASRAFEPGVLPASALAELAERLKGLYDELGQQIDAQRALLVEAGADSEGHAASSEDATLAEEEDEAVSRLRHAQGELSLVQEALARLDAGSYGQCADCGEAIGLERLQALPYARLCVRCQEAEEQHTREI